MIMINHLNLSLKTFSKKYDLINKFSQKTKLLYKLRDEDIKQYDHLALAKKKKELKNINRQRFYFRRIDQTKYLTSEISCLDDKKYPITDINEISECIYVNNIIGDVGIPADVNIVKLKKLLNVSIIGPYNSGKSSLFNNILNKNISAISSKKYTTSETIKGSYYNFKDDILLTVNDTIGFDTDRKINDSLNDILLSDCIIIVLDGSKEFQDDYLQTLTLIKNSNDFDNNIKIVLALNKIDKIRDKTKLKINISKIESIFNLDKIFFISCETKYNINSLLEYLKDVSIDKEDHYNYDMIKLFEDKGDKDNYVNYDPDIVPEKSYSDSVFIDLQNIIKSVIFNNFQKELPYLFDFEIIKLSFLSKNTMQILIKMIVYSKNQIGILTGKKGNKIDTMKKQIQVEVFKLLGFKLNIDIAGVVRRKKYISENNEGLIYPSDKLIEEQTKNEIIKLRKEGLNSMLSKIDKFNN